ncbi:MAG: mechanosensitive ion channel [Fervidicoccaceae archaeon]
MTTQSLLPRLLETLLLVAALLAIVAAVLGDLRRMVRRGALGEAAAEELKRILWTFSLAIILLVSAYSFFGSSAALLLLVAAITVGAFSSWKLLTNLSAYYALRFSAQLSEGKLVELDGVKAKIKSLGLLTTSLQTDEGDTILVPNSLLLDKVIKCPGGERTAVLRIGVSEWEEVDEVVEEVRRVVSKEFKHAARSGDFEVHLESLSPRRATLLLRVRYVGQREREEVADSLVRSLARELEKFSPEIELVRPG